MKNIHEVLRAKEQLLEETQKDIAALKHTIKLLTDEREESREASGAGAPSLSSLPVPPVVMRPAGSSQAGKEGTYSPWDAGSKQFP